MIGALVRWEWVARPWRRRLAFAVLAAILAILSLWPRPYLASTMLAPDDSAAGLSGLFGGGGGGNALASLLGGRGTIEADLLIGRSQVVMVGVARLLQSHGLYRQTSLPRLESKLRHKVDVEAIRGSILKISMTDHDPATARQVVEDFVTVLRQRLTDLSREQAVQKRAVARERMQDATRSLDEAQRTLNQYRAAHRFTGPDVQLGATIATEAGLQGQLEASQTTLLTIQKFEGPDNIQVQALKNQVNVLQHQIINLQTRGAAGGAPSLAKLNPQLTEYLNLSRDERYAAAEYDIYKRYLDALTVQEVAAPLNMDVIDPPFIDPQRHFNPAPMGAFVLVLVLAVLAEFYFFTPTTARV